MAATARRAEMPVDGQIIKWRVGVGQRLSVGDPICTYRCLHDDGTDQPLRRDLLSAIEGTVDRIMVKDNTTVTKGTTVLLYEDECAHDILLGGICAQCGRPVQGNMFGGNAGGFDAGATSGERSHVPVMHDTLQLTVSRGEATRLQQNQTERLTRQRKLVLVCDLDETLVHATERPHVRELVVDGPNKQPDVYPLSALVPEHYLRLRPGTRELLRAASDMYELHIYTFGGRAYADSVAKVLDPDGTIFDMTYKSLKRLFLVDDSLVVILDDRSKVWNHVENLIKIRPYEYFLGVRELHTPLDHTAAEDTARETEKDCATTHAGAAAGKQQFFRDPDNDDQLKDLVPILSSIHTRYYDEAGDDVTPDVKTIMHSMRSAVLLGCTICFSGVIPRGLNLQDTDLWHLVVSFGGRVEDVWGDHISHVVVHMRDDNRTDKVRNAIKRDDVCIVDVEWLLATAQKWVRQPEEAHVPVQLAQIVDNKARRESRLAVEAEAVDATVEDGLASDDKVDFSMADLDALQQELAEEGIDLDDLSDDDEADLGEDDEDQDEMGDFDEGSSGEDESFPPHKRTKHDGGDDEGMVDLSDGFDN